jgi:hypothetical protein
MPSYSSAALMSLPRITAFHSGDGAHQVMLGPPQR